MGERFWILDIGDGWFSLQGGRYWVSVEGDANEWRQTADAIEHAHRHGAMPHDWYGFKRLHAALNGFAIVFWSPRNRAGEGDDVKVPLDDVPGLVDDIRRAILREPSE